MTKLSTAALSLLAAIVLAVAGLVASGSLSLVTTHGISMQPRIASGDLVVVAPAASYGIGDSVAYRSAQLRTVVLHRIVAVEGDRYVFQGDNNDWLDPERPTQDELVGKELLHVPRGGIWLKRLTSPPALAAATFLLVTGGGTAAAVRTRRRRRKEGQPVTHSSTPARLLDGLSPALRPIAAGAAVLALAGAALSGLAWTRPATVMTTGSAPASSASTMDFSYTATVPPSAAYDGTTVTAPSPVFRALTDAVDVSYRYTGRPGALTVAAELSTPSGWAATVPLVGQERIAGEHEGVVRLDLDALEQRAEAAAAVIGLPAGTLTVAVVPTVTLNEGEEFAPALTLALDEHALTPTGELTATQATSPAAELAGVRAAPAILSALGRGIDVAHARIAGLAAAALALLAGLAMAVAARLAGPVSESERSRRKYGPLLLPVRPVALTRGRPVVDVPDIAALARLAERYGLLVLHWSRSGVETYVVLDETTTFRYRAGRVVATAAKAATPEKLPELPELPDTPVLGADSPAQSWNELALAKTRSRSTR